MAEFHIPGLGLATASQTEESVQSLPAQHNAPEDQTSQGKVQELPTDQDDKHKTQDTVSEKPRETAPDEDAEPMALDQHPAPSTSTDVDVTITDAPPSPPSLTSGLEALLGGLDPLPQQHSDTVPAQSADPRPEEQARDETGTNGQAGSAEWEEDSSPYESSSDSSSSDDSDDDDSEDGKDYEVLGPEETARILMEMEGGSDDDGDGKSKGAGAGGQVRTKNELPKEIIPKPDVVIDEGTEIIELGTVEHIITGENTVVIKAKTTGEYQVLDIGSALCLENRTVIAAVADVIAAVLQPRYTADFASEEEISSLGLAFGTKIFYPPKHASYCFSEALRGVKGTDASNWHDEEPADDEVEFSDDEKEAEHKRRQKAKKKGARGGKEGTGGRGGHRNPSNPASSVGLKYDDESETDGPYRKLARPAGFGQGSPPGSSNDHGSGYSGHGGAYGGARGDFRGRGNRARGARGNRGGPRGGYSMPTSQNDMNGPNFRRPVPSGQFNFSQAPQSQFGNSAYPQVPMQIGVQPNNGQQPAYPQHQFPNFPWPQNLPPGFVPPPPPQFTGQQPGVGSYYNPAFLASLQNQLQGQQGQYGPTGQQNGWSNRGGHG
ncbi:Gar1/Naf1 RNA binding region-domain-containing protein [Xylariaceae sp. FL0804]|nr:Gar1/Naf1 RNA binding region-domain-containing protein [Xylariaceae sp. FL0804]